MCAACVYPNTKAESGERSSEKRNTHLFSRWAWPVQANADIRMLASLASVAFCSRNQPKSHSAASPAAMAAQYTAERRF